MIGLEYRPRVTVSDVLETGACLEGVLEWVLRHRGVIAGTTADHLANDHIREAANADGDGSGSGYGDGDSDGSGDGSGYGSGDGSGYGSGYGN